MKHFKLKIKGLSGPLKISEYLKRYLSFSASLVTRVKFGGVFINGENVHMRAMIKNGDLLEVYFPEEESENIEAIPIKLDIIYEDNYIIAVNKPKNMPTHPSRGNNLPTLANALMAYFDGKFVFRAVNRLDRDTSGIVLIAKDAYTASRLSDNMKKGDFNKKYLAVVSGTPSPDKARIEAPIERACEGSLKRIVRPDGKPSITEYRVISIYENGNSLCELKLLTGRTHQIRVHMSYIGHPLVGDFLYGTEVGSSYFLHCSELSFTHPITNKRVIIKSKPDFL